MKYKANWYIEHRLKAPKAFFDWGLSQIPVYKWSNKNQTITSSDRKAHLIEKRLTKRSNLDFYGGFFAFAIVLVTNKRIEIQTYVFDLKINGGKEIIDHDLVNFEIFKENEHIKITNRIGWFGGQEYISGILTPMYGGMSGPYQNVTFYPNDWQTKIKTVSELKYLKFEDEVNYYDLDNLYKYRKEIEFLQKINAKKLAEQVWEKRVDMRTLNQKWLKKNKQFFKNSDRDFYSFELEKRIKERRGRVVPGIEKYISYRDIKFIPKDIGITRFQNWIIKNDIEFYYYKDYLKMLERIKVNARGDETLAMPKDLKKAHDEAVELYNQILEEEEKRRFEETLKVRKGLEREVGPYDFILPKKIGDIVQEGKQMHNCVGTYVNSHKSGQTTIIFIRKKEEPEQSFVTMEYKAGEIVQIRAKYNQDPGDEVKQVANQWLKEVEES